MAEIINTIVFPICRRDRILTALETLHENTPFNYKTVVVDQTEPEPEGFAFERQLWDSCDVVIKPHLNYGFAQAVNMGLDMARTKYATVCNDDVEFIPGHDWWAGIEATFEKFPKAAAVNPQTPKCPGWGWAEPGFRYMVPKGWPEPQLRRWGAHSRELQIEFRDVRLKAHKLSQDGAEDSALESKLRSLRREMIAHRERMAPLVYQATMAGPEYVQMLGDEGNWAVIDGFPCWLSVFRSDRLREIGFFDERFWPGGGEDYDMMARAYQAGYRMLASSKSWAWHWWGQSKDRSDGRARALPAAHEHWNVLSVKAGLDGLWIPDCDVWGHGCERTDLEVKRFPL